MSRYIRSQAEIRIEIDEDSDLVLTQITSDGNEYTIFVNFQNIESFISAIKGAVKDSYDGDKNEMV